MNVNESKRKRIVPQWMRSPSKSPQSKIAAPRPSYPQLPLKRTKQSSKNPEQTLERTKRQQRNKIVDSVSRERLKHEVDVGDEQSSSTEPYSLNLFNNSQSTSFTNPVIENFVMTVEDLTKVAQEVIMEERQRRAQSMLSRTSHKRAL